MKKKHSHTERKKERKKEGRKEGRKDRQTDRQRGREREHENTHAQLAEVPRGHGRGSLVLGKIAYPPSQSVGFARGVRSSHQQSSAEKNGDVRRPAPTGSDPAPWCVPLDPWAR